jgi:hypothetical protein
LRGRPGASTACGEGIGNANFFSTFRNPVFKNPSGGLTTGRWGWGARSHSRRNWAARGGGPNRRGPRVCRLFVGASRIRTLGPG